MSDTVDEQLSTQLDDLAAERLRVEATMNAEKEAHRGAVRALEDEHADRMSEYVRRAQELDRTIWLTIRQHWSTLMPGSARSFRTMRVTFSMKKVNATTAVIDKDAIMELARKLGVVKQLADPPRAGWTFNKKKFLAWLQRTEKYRARFKEFLRETPTHDSLSVKYYVGDPAIFSNELSDEGLTIYEQP